MAAKKVVNMALPGGKKQEIAWDGRFRGRRGIPCKTLWIPHHVTEPSLESSTAQLGQPCMTDP